MGWWDGMGGVERVVSVGRAGKEDGSGGFVEEEEEQDRGAKMERYGIFEVGSGKGGEIG